MSSLQHLKATMLRFRSTTGLAVTTVGALALLGGAALGIGLSKPSLAETLPNHTLLYKEATSEVEHAVYFGRFGNNYDRYVPCNASYDEEHLATYGTWHIASDKTLCLQDGNEAGAKACYQVKVAAQNVSMVSQDGKSSFKARLVEGNRLPFG